MKTAVAQPQFKIVNTTPRDLSFIYELFDLSVKYQEARGYPSWKNYDKGALTLDVENKQQYKVIIDTQIGIVFSVRYSDKVIWRAMDQGDAIYLHRIVVNPAFKGQKLFGQILNWAIQQAKQKRLGFVRMDTWAANEKIIDYYKGFGFKFIGNYTTPDTDELPKHNRNLALALLELKL
ncbi:MAG TPA: GNAT family N-acetyltransferase [Cyclobacteriaceae bacterium]|jgi:GNAT superfamily N-acetyltransferase|nr:GNAT family N-acetyltransferase [Cyclobacteriaceae bacterium]